MLSELKEKGVLLYILSNWSAETYPIAEERFDFLSWFDGKIISGEAGIVKPDLEIYKLLMNRYEVKPQTQYLSTIRKRISKQQNC
ncbi:MAG: hypothetical protein Ct9H300mP28_10300 [Pseudomonadota bacterium]|nr:MAG: hypothetical protein Ct9H300mP28_10300 [Pseudomonadota bacterium]